MPTRVQRLIWMGPAWVPAFLCAGQSAAPPSPAFTLAGRVVDSAGTAVPNAQVELLESGLVLVRMRSDSAGRFRAPGRRVRSFELSVRRLGFEPRTVAVAVPDSLERAYVRIVLAPAITQLSATEVLAARETDVRLHSFYDRVANNKFGSYIEPEAIERRQPIYASELLRTVAGVRVQPAERGGNRVTIRGCAPVVWVDGARMQQAQLDEVVRPENVAAIEVYRSFSGLPSEYFDRSANCGSIIVWTKLK